MRILVVEDDAALARGLIATFKSQGFAADHVARGEDVAEIEARENYSVIVLDVTLPGMSGFEVLRRIRGRGSKTPVLMLTARDAVRDRVSGLDLGADDYVLKPFDPGELCARIRALVRRSEGDPTPTLTVGSLRLDRSAGVAHVHERPLDLRRREWAVLEGLVMRAGKVVARARLESEVFGYDDPVGPNALEVYVGRLRKKLEPDGPSIRTIRGVGYMIDCQ
jgi:DNA-binding response OmpR family regulator